MAGTGSGVVRQYEFVNDLIRREVKPYWRKLTAKEKKTKHNIFQLWDNRYYIPSAQEAENMVRKVCLDLPKYSADDFDCDDIAFYARGRAGGYAARRRWSNAGIAMGIFDAQCKWVKYRRHIACWLLRRNKDRKIEFMIFDPADYRGTPPPKPWTPPEVEPPHIPPDPEPGLPMRHLKQIHTLRAIIG